MLLETLGIITFTRFNYDSRSIARLMKRGKWLNGTVNIIEFISFERFEVINLTWLTSTDELNWIGKFGAFYCSGNGRHKHSGILWLISNQNNNSKKALICY
jgi:hypothetical protein